MIVLTVIIDEEERGVTTEGFFTTLKPTLREEQMVNGLLDALEKYCMSRGKEGSVFLSRHPTETNEKEDKDNGQ